MGIHTDKKAFTFTELIVVVTILAILSTIGFISYVGFVSSSRDTKRTSDLALIETSLKTQKQKKGSYPLPGDSFKLTNSGELAALQGRLNKNVSLSELDTLPVDPKSKYTYFYATTKNKQEYEIAGTLENDDNPKSILVGDYKSVSKNTLPTILLSTATGANNNIEITLPANKKLFIFNDSEHNYPYTFESDTPYSDGTNFAKLLEEAESKDYWQNSDYSSCLEIYEAAKSISSSFSTQEYQYLSGGTLVNANCDMSSF